MCLLRTTFTRSRAFGKSNFVLRRPSEFVRIWIGHRAGLMNSDSASGWPSAKLALTQQVAMATLLTDEERTRMLDNGSARVRGEPRDPLPLVKLFTPDFRAVW